MLRLFCSAALSWLGIVGGFITVFSNLDTLFKLADWARVLVDKWKWWLDLGWELLLSRFRFNLTTSARFQMTMAVTIIFMAIGARLSASREGGDGQIWKPGWQNILRANVAAAVVIFAAHSWFFGYQSVGLNFEGAPWWVWPLYSAMFYVIYAAAIFVGLMHWPLSAAATGTLGAVIFSEAFQRAAHAIGSRPAANETMSHVVGSGFAIFAGLFVVYLAPPRSFAYRVWLLVLGLALLIGLNELSKFGWELTAPTFQK